MLNIHVYFSSSIFAHTYLQSSHILEKSCCTLRSLHSHMTYHFHLVLSYKPLTSNLACSVTKIFCQLCCYYIIYYQLLPLPVLPCSCSNFHHQKFPTVRIAFMVVLRVCVCVIPSLWCAVLFYLRQHTVLLAFLCLYFHCTQSYQLLCYY